MNFSASNQHWFIMQREGHIDKINNYNTSRTFMNKILTNDEEIEQREDQILNLNKNIDKTGQTGPTTCRAMEIVSSMLQASN